MELASGQMGCPEESGPVYTRVPLLKLLTRELIRSGASPLSNVFDRLVTSACHISGSDDGLRVGLQMQHNASASSVSAVGC